ncbi:MAG: type II toxin-antitoxin system HicA family toxin [Nanoarchaeota archaeon]
MKLTNIKSKEVVKILQKYGFEIKRQSGTHIILRKDNKTVVVPVHKVVIPVGTLKSIEKQSGIDFREILS